MIAAMDADKPNRRKTKSAWTVVRGCAISEVFAAELNISGPRLAPRAAGFLLTATVQAAEVFGTGADRRPRAHSSAGPHS
jgi:hypothetical protein